MHLADWLEKHQIPCFYKSYFGMDCPGCGMQRAFIALLRGHILDAFKLYPALFTIILMLLFLVLHLRFSFSKGALMLKYLFVLNAFIILGNYLYHQIAYYG